MFVCVFVCLLTFHRGRAASSGTSPGVPHCAQGDSVPHQCVSRGGGRRERAEAEKRRKERGEGKEEEEEGGRGGRRKRRSEKKREKREGKEEKEKGKGKKY